MKEQKANAQNGIALPVDLIRTIAITLVILLHASIEPNPNISQMSPEGVQLFWVSNVYNSISRTAVPLFVMLTGALLLQPTKHDEPIRLFFRKRWNRIGLPVIFWGAIYFAYDFTVKGNPLTLTSFLQGVLAGPYVHFWYLYLLVGLYLITPLIRVLVAHADWVLMKYFLLLWLVGTGIVSLLTLSAQISSQAAWFESNVFILTGIVGYFVLGAYVNKLQTRFSYLCLGLVVGTLTTILTTYFVIGSLGEAYSQFFLTANSITVIVASIALFLVIASISQQKIEANMPRANKILRTISENTLPIYLFHIIVLETLQSGVLGITLSLTTMNPILEIPLTTFVTLIICLAIIVPLKKLPYMKNILG
jgi:surface polysaccharide O-acyltransferase-like enzyme